MLGESRVWSYILKIREWIKYEVEKPRSVVIDKGMKLQAAADNSLCVLTKRTNWNWNINEPTLKFLLS